MLMHVDAFCNMLVQPKLQVCPSALIMFDHAQGLDFPVLHG